MITIGVTGGIGSGKTTVCRILEELGARVFYADLEARRIMQANPRVRRELEHLLGTDVYRPDGTLDRPEVARRMFADAGRVAAVNRIVHPRVRDAFARARRRALRDGVEVFVKEAALLLDSGSGRSLDAIVVVTAPEQVRIRRVVDRDGVAAAAVRDRMRHQRSQEAFVEAADHVVTNGGDEAALRVQVAALWRRLTAVQPHRP